MTSRHLRELWRQPWFVGVTLVQPVIWLLLFGALFKKIVEIPGFHGHSYIGFLAPGVVVMTAMFNSTWSGMALIEDLNRGVTARFLVSPVRREALSNGFALIMRQEEALIGAVQFIVLPLTFLSSTFLQANLMPHWIQTVANFNPVNWAVVAGRAATSSHTDWEVVASRAGLLAVALAACMAFATRAFKSYRASV